jgi:hypothetical protein
MRRGSRPPERHLLVPSEPDAEPDPVGRQRDEVPGGRAASSRATPNDAAMITEGLVRAGWSMRLHALLGEEVARAVDADILTIAEAEVLLARLAIVIDQAVGASEN